MKETAAKIKTFGQPVLRRKAEAVEEVTDEHRLLFDEMARIMYEVKGVGLAAPQIGLIKALIVIDIGNGLIKMANPVIIKKEGAQSMEEGCLSVPGVGVTVKRFRKVTVEGLNERGEPVRIEAEGFLATVFQHECDHLEGKMIVDHASMLERIRIKPALDSMKRKVSGHE
jgi:peptide deformylase